MELRARYVVLYGRFSPGVRDYLAREIETRSGRPLRDLTRRADILVIGARADSLIENGVLAARLIDARRRGKVICGEATFRSALQAASAQLLNFPIATALNQSGASMEDALLLAAFDLIALKGDSCRFGDVGLLKMAASLREAGCSSRSMINALRETHRRAPEGRHRLAMTQAGEPVLRWEDELTTLDGQRFLPFEGGDCTTDDLFETAAQAEADGQLEEAARLFDMCARADRSDAIAIYNLGNIRLRQERWADAALAYQRALARESGLLEAKYNLAQALESLGRIEDAISQLKEILHKDRDYADAVFNLGTLLLKQERLVEARNLFERYLRMNPPGDWSTRARRAITFCSQCLSPSQVDGLIQRRA